MGMDYTILLLTIFGDYIKASLLAEISNSDSPSSLNNLVIFFQNQKKLFSFFVQYYVVSTLNKESWGIDLNKNTPRHRVIQKEQAIRVLERKKCQNRAKNIHDKKQHKYNWDHKLSSAAPKKH